MTAVHRLDSIKNSALPSIAEIMSDAFVLPLFSPCNSMPPQPTSDGGAPDQHPITYRTAAVTGKLERCAQSPVNYHSSISDGYSPIPNPISVYLGRLPSGQMLLPNGLFPPRQHCNALYPQADAEAVSAADKQYKDTMKPHNPVKDGKKRRGRAAPPSRCHRCNRIDTPEWRRGPDGAGTLCNACGLRHAKLERAKLEHAKLERKRKLEANSLRPSSNSCN
ncbi:GATA zinc finger domain-containing protein 7 [Beauveria bassiana D1-5]|uniref:GATA zinc finger domain-containing protein 7 n=1 Tax=Beauveria bassiana D1-5 TaxID=1245745 RepID=A0A0A2V626_BEABA|nr:GATA zinc finger domain-containing protein 7 [Beauveria bassiana D1-5]